MRAQAGQGRAVAFKKASVPHFVPNPFVKDDAPKIDLTPLNDVLEVDVEGRVCRAESGV